MRFLHLLLKVVLILKDGLRSSLKQILLFWLRTSWLQKDLQIFSEIEIPALTNCLGEEDKEDRSLCPVRALTYYLSRTSDIRYGKSLPFVLSTS